MHNYSINGLSFYMQVGFCFRYEVKLDIAIQVININTVKVNIEKHLNMGNFYVNDL